MNREDITTKQIIAYAIPWISLIAVATFNHQGIVIIIVAICAAFTTMMLTPDNRKEKEIEEEVEEEVDETSPENIEEDILIVTPKAWEKASKQIERK